MSPLALNERGPRGVQEAILQIVPSIHVPIPHLQLSGIFEALFQYIFLVIEA